MESDESTDRKIEGLEVVKFEGYNLVRYVN